MKLKQLNSNLFYYVVLNNVLSTLAMHFMSLPWFRKPHRPVQPVQLRTGGSSGPVR